MSFFDSINPFAPDEKTKQSVQDAAAAWTDLEAKMSKDVKLAKLLKSSHDHWLVFWKNWQAGDRDLSDVRAVIADVNASRANALKIFTQDDPERVKDVDTLSSTARRAADSVDAIVHRYAPEFVDKLTDPADGSFRRYVEKKLLDNKLEVVGVLAAVAVIALATVYVKGSSST